MTAAKELFGVEFSVEHLRQFKNSPVWLFIVRAVSNKLEVYREMLEDETRDYNDTQVLRGQCKELRGLIKTLLILTNEESQNANITKTAVDNLAATEWGKWAAGKSGRAS